jgi:hypothetical protein
LEPVNRDLELIGTDVVTVDSQEIGHSMFGKDPEPSAGSAAEVNNRLDWREQIDDHRHDDSSRPERSIGDRLEEVAIVGR